MADVKSGIPILPEAEAVAARAKLRDQLKTEFRKQVYHPFRGHTNTYIFDPAFQRFASMKVSGYDFFKATPKTVRYTLIPTIAIYVGTYLLIDHYRTKKENLFRSGTVAYKDRKSKYM